MYIKKTDYTVSGTTLTFDTGLTVGDVVEVNAFTVSTLGNTDTMAEGVSNLYHTTARARGAISVSGNALSYNSSTGVITSAYEESPAFTGNVSIGSTLHSWDSNFQALQVKNSVLYNNNVGDTFLGANFYFDGSNNKYISTDYAAAYGQQEGAHNFYVAASGTAGNNVTFTTHYKLQMMVKL